jgi:hypothetical protein
MTPYELPAGGTRAASPVPAPALELPPRLERPPRDATHKIDEAGVDRGLKMEVPAPHFVVGKPLKLALAVQDLADVKLHPRVVAGEPVERFGERSIVGEDRGVEARGLGGRRHPATTTANDRG